MPAVNRGYRTGTGMEEIRRPENMNNASVEEFFDKVLTVRLTPDRQALDIIDQTLLPGTVKRINLSTKEEIWEAIKKLRVRGAPAIGVSAAYGMAVLSSRSQVADFDSF
jgi:methylthioribose-1-phosphate isomerase